MSKQKGDRRERQAVALYEGAGYEVERATAGGSHSRDYFDLFDLMAFEPGRGLTLVQVRSNGAKGIEAFCEETLPFQKTRGLAPVMLVCYDGHGGPNPTPRRWRLIFPGGEDCHVTAVDERDDGTPADGDGVGEWLREHSDPQVVET